MHPSNAVRMPASRRRARGDDAEPTRGHRARVPARVVTAALGAALGIALVVAAGGCGARQTHYYTLSDVDAPALAPAPAASALVGVGPVDLPDYVDRPQIVVRTGENAVEQAPFDQWGGSLDDMVPAVLVDDLAKRLPGDHFVAFPQSGDLAFDYRVPVRISRFDVTAGGDAVVSARWQVRDRTGVVAVRETTARATAEGAGYPSRVAALSRALGTLADEIARELATLPRPAAPTGKSGAKR